MGYSAQLIEDANRPSIITLGRFTYRVRDISAVEMLRFQAVHARGDAMQTFVALVVLLRVAFPRRWWHRFYADPVRVILGLPADLRDKVIGEILRMPGGAERNPADLSPVEALRKMQRELVYGAAAARKPQNVPTLALAVARVRATYGDVWYFNPGRWATADGYVPWRVVWAEYQALGAIAAHERIERASAAAVLHAKNSTRTLDDWFREAHPPEAMN